MAMTLDDIKKLSPQMKALIICLFYLLSGYFYYFYFLQEDLEKRGNLQTKLQELDQQVASKEKLAAEVGKYAKGVSDLKESFKIALTKLPIRQEIPELLKNVALSGKEAGITFLLFEPQVSVKKPIGGKKAPDQKPPGQNPAPPNPAPSPAIAEQKPGVKKPEDAKGQPSKQLAAEEEYYEEIPVKVTVTGGYQNTAVFFEKVARLPRIINIENISMGESKSVKGRGWRINTSCIVKTYMFVQKTGETVKKNDEKKP